MSIEKLVVESRRYGSDDRFVLLGGGNTSFKKDGVLYVKASGTALGSIKEEGFVKMDLKRLDTIWTKTYSEEDDAREEEVLKDMMACRLDGEVSRPSVEALLHSLLPFPYVVHLHPALVNGVTCAVQGEQAVQKLFPEALWIELVKPGFVLASVVRKRLQEIQKESGKTIRLIFLQNHGVFVGGENLQEIATLYDMILATIEAQVKRKPDFTELPMDSTRISHIVETLEQVSGKKVHTAWNTELTRILSSQEAFAPVSSSFTPDHIVYSGFKPLWVGMDEDVQESYRKFEKEYGCEPKIVCVEKTGVFSCGEKPLLLFLDSVKVSVYAESFGGPLFMTEEMILFIRTWEVEKYRNTQSITEAI